jgi:ribokinase
VPVDVCVLGSANLDLVATVARLPSPGETLLGNDYFEAPGGKGLNQAVAAARAGASVAFVGCVGGDDAGRGLRDVLEGEGIDTRGLENVDAPTGRALIGVADSGENSIIVVPGANAMVSPGLITIHGSLIASAAVALAQLEVPLEPVVAAFAALRHVGGMTILNPAPARPLPRELLMVTDIVVPNEHEAEVLGGVDAILAAGATTVVVTEGERGARVVTPEGEHRIEAFEVTPIDTTAAGDAFCGALAARLAAGDRLLDALHWAAAAGALATTAKGAMPSLPRRGAIEVLVSDAG